MKITKATRRQIQDWLDISPDAILLNTYRISFKVTDVDFLIDMLSAVDDIVHIQKYTLNGIEMLSIQRIGSKIVLL